MPGKLKCKLVITTWKKLPRKCMEKLGLYIKITNNWESFTDPLGQAEAWQWYAYVNNR